MPDYLRDFLPRLEPGAGDARRGHGGADGRAAQRLRRVGASSWLSVLPKDTPALRKAFLVQLPGLMKTLNEGLNLSAGRRRRRDFFGQLMPAHAESLRAGAERSSTAT